MCRSPSEPFVCGEDFPYGFKPARSGRGAALPAPRPCRSATGRARPGRAGTTDRGAEERSTHDGEQDQGNATTGAGFLVRAERHRPCRPPQPRFAHLATGPGRRPEAESLSHRRGRGRRRAVSGLPRPSRSMRRPGRRGRGQSDQAMVQVAPLQVLDRTTPALGIKSRSRRRMPRPDHGLPPGCCRPSVLP